MQRWTGRVAAVTGASAGIGASITAQLLDAGLNVVALARGVDKIPGAVQSARKDAQSRGRSGCYKAPAPGQLHTRACDVQKEADIVAAFKWIKDALGGVDVLVNCAGLSGETKLLDNNTNDWRRVLEINVLGLSICTREAVQQMRAKGDQGHVVHINSVAGHITPFLCEWSMYHASKHGVRVLTEGLRKELVAAKSKIRVTEVSPGMVRTNFLKDDSKIAPAGEWYSQRAHLFPEDVADAVLYALGTPPHVQIHEIMIKPVGEEV